MDNLILLIIFVIVYKGYIIIEKRSNRHSAKRLITSFCQLGG